MKKLFLILLVSFSINALLAQTSTATIIQTTPAKINAPATVTNKLGIDCPNTSLPGKWIGNIIQRNIETEVKIQTKFYTNNSFIHQKININSKNLIS